MVRTPGDPSSDILRYRSRPLDAFFAPRAVAVIGATDKPGSVGRTVFANLLATRFGGNVYPVNPNRPEVLGQRTFPDVAAIPEQVDLAVVVTPPATVPGLLDACGRVGVRAAIVISAGFKEVGPRERNSNARWWSVLTRTGCASSGRTALA
jgi:acetyltransferase